MWYLMWSDVVIPPSKISVVRIDGWDVQENRKSQYSFATVSHGSHFVTVHGMEQLEEDHAAMYNPPQGHSQGKFVTKCRDSA
jgi:hypothetical protein